MTACHQFHSLLFFPPFTPSLRVFISIKLTVFTEILLLLLLLLLPPLPFYYYYPRTLRVQLVRALVSQLKDCGFEAQELQCCHVATGSERTWWQFVWVMLCSCTDSICCMLPRGSWGICWIESGLNQGAYWYKWTLEKHS